MLLIGNILSGVIVFDVVLGFAKAWATKTWDSLVGRKGLVSHIGAIVLIYFVIIVDPIINIPIYTNTISTLISFLALAYAGSIVENLSELGVPFPKWLSERMTKVMDSKEREEEENDKKY